MQFIYKFSCFCSKYPMRRQSYPYVINFNTVNKTQPVHIFVYSSTLTKDVNWRQEVFIDDWLQKLKSTWPANSNVSIETGCLFFLTESLVDIWFVLFWKSKKHQFLYIDQLVFKRLRTTFKNCKMICKYVKEIFYALHIKHKQQDDLVYRICLFSQ